MQLRIEHLPCTIDRDVVAPCFLSEVDHPWLQRLVERAQALEGVRAADVEDALLAPLPLQAPPAKHRLAAFILSRGLAFRTDAAVAPAEARDRLFSLAARLDAPRPVLVERAAAALGVGVDQLMSSLFADLPGERIVVGLIEETSPVTLAARANSWLAAAFVSRATRVRIDVVGASRQLVRAAKSKGLLTTVIGAPDGAAAVLELSGPLSLFKHTRLYGRALASLLPTLSWCDRWLLEADCVVASRRVQFRLSTGAPILPSPAPKRFDSKVEERFAREFVRHAPGWTLIREPRPLIAGDALVFPDFAIEGDAGTFFVEIVGFWTPQYIEQKLVRYRRARLSNLILCVDAGLACAEGDLPASVVRFERRVDVTQVLERVRAGCSAKPAARHAEPGRASTPLRIAAKYAPRSRDDPTLSKLERR